MKRGDVTDLTIKMNVLFAMCVAGREGREYNEKAFGVATTNTKERAQTSTHALKREKLKLKQSGWNVWREKLPFQRTRPVRIRAGAPRQ